MLKTVTICRSVYPLRFILLLGILFSFNVFAKQSGEEYIIERENWKAFIRLSDGTVDRYEFREHGVWKTIPFRHDRMAGPAWDGIMLAHDKKKSGIVYRRKRPYFIQYLVRPGARPSHRQMLHDQHGEYTIRPETKQADSRYR